MRESAEIKVFLVVYKGKKVKEKGCLIKMAFWPNISPQAVYLLGKVYVPFC